ncbi:MAG: cobyric acid synthase [Hyphomicrobiaceae bacterium]
MSTPAAIMIQGTGSNVGKSLLVAGLCRHFARQGLAVRPFKPQNMSNNAAATADGGEIGRAQALQARACGLAASVHMNPVLLKPESETGAQVIVQGRRLTTMRAREYGERKGALLEAVLESFALIGQGGDLVIVEGAGSPAEVNLRAGDIANMGFARAASVPVIIAGDIDRGGVIASLVGCHAVLEPADRAIVRGYLINRMRGDASLFDDGLAIITRMTGWPSLGIVPHFSRAGDLPAEDSLDLDMRARLVTGGDAPLRIVVPRLPRIANFDDLDPLRLEPGVSVEMISPAQPLPRDAGLILLPGSKATVADLAALRAEGWDIDILAHARQGGRVVGICGGYQMLGRTIADPDGIEGPPGTVAGLGLLEVDTVLSPDKRVIQRTGHDALTGEAVAAYEIHLGRTTGPDTERPLVVLDGVPDGARSANGCVTGTYLHGLFTADAWRQRFLAGLVADTSSGLAYDRYVEETLDALASHLAAHLDTEQLLAMARAR